MIIDCHGHYTTAPKQLQEFRDAQMAGLKDLSKPRSKATLSITDDEIRQSLEGAQLKFQRERGTDVTIFSPRASAMGHHIGDATTSEHVSRMIAMKSATDSADKVVKSLTMRYNRARQSQITTELSEIMGGVEAMKG